MDARRPRPTCSRQHQHRQRPPGQHHLLGALVVGLAVLVVAACGSADGGTASAGASPTPSVTARSLLVSVGELPQGFRDSGGQDEGYRQTVCGVDIEPVPPVDSASARFSEGPLGPFVEQRVRVYAGDTDVVSRVKAALAGCTEYSLPASAGSPAVTLEVRPFEMPAVGDESVAWSQTARTDVPITTDVVMIRSGHTVVLVTSYSLKDPPDPEVAVSAAQAVAARLQR